MKEIIEKYGVNDFFSYVCPGIIVLLSLLFWVKPQFDKDFWKQELIVGFFLLVLAYTIGLILTSYNRIANIWGKNLTLSVKSKQWLARRIREILIVIFSFSKCGNNPRICEWTILIVDTIYDNSFTLVEGLSSLCSWEWTLVCRTILAGHAGNDCEHILTEAESVNRRFMFSLNVALALLIVGIQASLRLVIDLFTSIISTFLPHISLGSSQLPTINNALLIVIIIVTGLSSFQMRYIANGLYYVELYLTAHLAELCCMNECR